MTAPVEALAARVSVTRSPWLDSPPSAKDVRTTTPKAIMNYVQESLERQRATGEAIPPRVARPWSLIEQVVACLAEDGCDASLLPMRAFVPVGRRAFAGGLQTLLRYGRITRHRSGTELAYRPGSGRGSRPPSYRKLLEETIAAEWFVRQCSRCQAMDFHRPFASAGHASGSWTCPECGLDQENFGLPRLWLFELMEWRKQRENEEGLNG